MKKALLGFMGVSLATCSVGAFGATVSNLTSNDGNRDAYSTNAKWSGGVAPANDSSAAYDFVVANGYNLWLPLSNDTPLQFGGASVQFGSKSSSASLLYRGDRRWVTFPDLRLYEGSFASGANDWLGLAGNATVYSTVEKPFTFTFKRDYQSYLDLKLTGGPDSIFTIERNGNENGPGYVFVYADQSQTYEGSWKIGPGVQFRPTYDADRGKIANSTMTFGKPLAVFNPKSVIMGAGSLMRVETSQHTFLTSDNRGLWLDAAGSTVSYVIINNNVHQFGWPIAGDGTFNVYGNGSLYLQAPCAVPLKIQSGINLVIDYGAELKSGFICEEGASFCIRQVVTDGVPSDRPARLSTVLDASLRPIGVCLSAIPTVETTTDIPVAVIDKAVAASYAEDDFDPWGVAGAQIHNAEKIVFSTDANGDTVVSVRLFPFARSNVAAGQIVLLDNAGQWTPYGAPAAGNNYVVWNNSLRTGGNDWQTYAVPGEQWVMYNTGNDFCTYQSKHFNTTFNNLRLLNGTGVAVAQTDTFRTLEFSGNYDIRTTKDSNVVIMGASVKTKVSATLTGRGTILIQGVSRNPELPNSDYSVEMAGDASGYVGTVDSQNYSQTAYPMVLKASEESNFGGNPERFAADALKIGTMVALTPTAAMTIDDENRGVTFANGASVDTTFGDVTIKTPVAFEGAFTKDGTGTFALGAGGVTFGTGASIAVNAGTLKTEGVNALKGATVSFADGAVLAFDATVGAVDLTTTTFSKAGDKYLVRIDGLQDEATIATFASAQAAADFVANAKTVKGTAHKGYLFSDGATVKAGVSGLSIILR